MFLMHGSGKDQFISELETLVKKKSSKKTLVDEQWLSEKEMKDDLGWSAHLVSTSGHVR